MKLQINTPRWAVPLLEPNRLKGARGGRSSGKSHFFAELCVELLTANKDARIVCIREIQKSLKFSAKKLIEDKIKALGVGHLFEVLQTEIKRIDGDGFMIFQGMQDHTSESIKSLEGFDIAWVEEAQSLSARSIELLIPTIRSDDSELWFSWNPEKKTNAVETLFNESPSATLVHVNYPDNPWCPNVMIEEALRMRSVDMERYSHIWLGGFNEVSEAQVFKGKYQTQAFTPKASWSGPYFGLDYGFASSATAGVKTWVFDDTLYIEHELYEKQLELDDTAPKLIAKLPDVARHTIRADNARPESTSYIKRHGIPRAVSCKKGKGSVEDGIQFIKSFKRVIIHPRCTNTLNEFSEYSYKVDKYSGDILPDLVDEHNHIIDALRYALEPIMKRRSGVMISRA